MRLSLAAVRKYVHIICMRLLYINGIIIHARALYQIQIMASLSHEDAVYLIESVIEGLHTCKRVQSPTVFKGLQLTCEDRNDDRFAACLQV